MKIFLVTGSLGTIGARNWPDGWLLFKSVSLSQIPKENEDIRHIKRNWRVEKVRHDCDTDRIYVLINLTELTLEDTELMPELLKNSGWLPNDGSY